MRMRIRSRIRVLYSSIVGIYQSSSTLIKEDAPLLPHTHTHRETRRRLVARPANYQHLALCVFVFHIMEVGSWSGNAIVFLCVWVYSSPDISKMGCKKRGPGTPLGFSWTTSSFHCFSRPNSRFFWNCLIWGPCNCFRKTLPSRGGVLYSLTPQPGILFYFLNHRIRIGTEYYTHLLSFGFHLSVGEAEVRQFLLGDAKNTGSFLIPVYDSVRYSDYSGTTNKEVWSLCFISSLKYE